MFFTQERNIQPVVEKPVVEKPVEPANDQGDPAELKRLRGEVLRLQTVIDEKSTDDLRIIHGVADNVSYAISRRWFDHFGRPTIESLLKLQNKAHGSHFRLVDDGKDVHVEADFDLKSWRAMESAQDESLAAVVAFGLLEKVSEGSDKATIHKWMGHLKHMTPQHIAAGILASGTLRSFTLATVINDKRRLVIRGTIDSKAWSCAMQTPGKFLELLAADAKIAAKDLP